MANKINYSPLAQSDLDEIFNYISDTLQNPSAAQNTISGIFDSHEILKDFSEVGTQLFLGKTLTDYRFVRYNNYLSFYRIVDEDVFIDRILYGGRDYIKVLFE